MAGMYPKLTGNPLIAWRGHACLQIGWGDANLRVEDAPERLPEWLRLLDGSRTTVQLMRAATTLGMDPSDAESLLDGLQKADLLEPAPRVAVSLAPCGLLAEPLTEALRRAGLKVAPDGPAMVFPQGQLPSFAAAPEAARLVPLWFSTRAVHIGPVIDIGWGPCPQCVDRRWGSHDPDWPTLVSQAGLTVAPSSPGHLALAAAGVLLVASAESAAGLELILDPTNPGPRWRVWPPESGCECGAAPDMAMAGPRLETRHC